MNDPFEALGAEVAGSYAIVREIGRGGFARVYLARDARHGRDVAVKVLHPDLAAALGAERFHHEVRIAAGLVHPNIVPLIDSGAAGPFLFYVMPFMPGESLRARLLRERQVPLADAVAIVGQVAAALDYAHRRRIIHRDIKPENILLVEGQAVVADFGVARAIDSAGGDRITSTGFVVGTPAYMSPEQAAADPVLDGRSDEYALACVAYEMLAGQPPFTGANAQAISALRLTATPPAIHAMREQVPDAVDAAIRKALARVPADRHGGPGALAAAIGEAAGRSGKEREEAGNHQRERAGAGRKGWWIGMGALGLAAAAALALVLRNGVTPAARRDTAVLSVVPPTPASPDSALERLGRDLAVTVSQTLDGVGGLRTVDAQTVIGRWAGVTGPRGREAAEALGRELGAGSVLHGSLIRVGEQVQVALILTGGDSTAPLARVTASAHTDSIGALTDSIARSLLRQVFRRGPGPSPSLDEALRTRSLEALRAFLEGEREASLNRFREAAASYGRAVAADTSFWLGWARLASAQAWSLQDAEPALARAIAHRAELPPRDRMLVEAQRLVRSDLAAAIDTLRAATELYPDSWLLWMNYGDLLVHYGPILGRPLEDAQDALARAVALNTGFVPSWEHYVWVALLRRDTAEAARGIAALTRVGAGPFIGDSSGYGGDQLLQFRTMHALLRGDAPAADSLRRAVIADLRRSREPLFAANFFVRNAEPAEQVRVSDAVLAGGVPVGAEQFHQENRMSALFQRGDWDAAIAALAEGRAGFPRAASERARYQFAAAGAWLGYVDPTDAALHRPAMAAAVQSTHDRADLSYRDGLLALSRGDSATVAGVIREIEAGGDSHARLLARSLGLVSRAGRVPQAARELAALEEERAKGLLEADVAHPALAVVNRLAAARALVGQGDPVRARALLLAADARYVPRPGFDALAIALPLFELERARAAVAMGEHARARRHYLEVLRLCDRCPGRLAWMVEEARAGGRAEGR